MQALIDFNGSIAGHGHAMSPSVPGRSAASAIEQARTKIAELIGADQSNQIVFTSTCSQACEWAIHLVEQWDKFDKIHMSQTEHSAVKQAVRDKFPDGVVIDMPVNKHGLTKAHVIPPNDIVVCIHVQNEIGVIQPINDIQTNFLISDMSQDLGKLPTNLSSLPHIQLAMFGAHKFGGPGGVGFLFIRDTNLWKEFGTGSRYFMDRPGTPDAALIVATAVALEDVIKTMPERYERMIAFRDTLEPGLEEMGWSIIGKQAIRVPNTTFAMVPRTTAVHLMGQLGGDGVHVGLGSACGSLSTGPSPLMAAIGQGGSSHNYMRISQFGEYASKEAKLVLSKMRRYCPKGCDIP
jgi:cysteine desulfurase